jgi:hypothetical protein
MTTECEESGKQQRPRRSQPFQAEVVEQHFGTGVLPHHDLLRTHVHEACR